MITLPMPFTFSPLPHDEAVARIGKLPLVSREVMDGLLPELRAYAFTITGLDVGDQMAKVRDHIKAVPAGEQTWAQAKKQIAADLVDDLGGKASQRRAELLLRTHVFRSYAATRYRNLMQQVDVFPFWQYKTHGDGNVRPSHAALNGKIFPAGHDIWQRIFPPWDWGCRCIVVPLTARSADQVMQRGKISDAAASDAHLLPTQIAKPEIFTDAEATIIDKNQRLPGGIPLNRTPTWSDSPWSIPGNVHHDWKLIEARYADQPEVLASFRQWAIKTPIVPGVTVDDWITNGVATPPAKALPKLTLKTPKAAKKATAAPSTNVAEALKIAGIDPAQAMTKAQAKTLLKELVEAAPVKASTKIASVANAPKKGRLRETAIRRHAQAFLNFLPPSLVGKLPQLQFRVVQNGLFYGSYNGGGKLLLNSDLLQTTEKVKSTVFHEMMHWVHRELPGTHPWVAEIRQHFEARTLGEALAQLPSYDSSVVGKLDHWWEEYMGRIYGYPEEATHLGLEFPTRIAELLADPERLAAVWSSSPAAREDIQLAMKGLYP